MMTAGTMDLLNPFMDKYIISGQLGLNEYVTGMSGGSMIVANKF